MIKNLFVKVRGLVEGNLKLTVLLLVVLAAAFTFGSYEALHFSSDPQFCFRCHPKQEAGPLGEVYTWEKSVHAKAGVECLNCHAEPGLIGYMRAKMGGLYDVYGEFIKGPEHKMHVLMSSSDSKYAARLVKNDVCMFCHTDKANKEIRAKTVMSIGFPFRMIDGVVNPDFRKKHGLPDIIAEGVRPTTGVDPRHKKHFEMGINCVNCHARITHSGIPGYRTTMVICFDCHDKMRETGKQPPANEDCTVCHRNEKEFIPQEPIVFGTEDSAVKFDHGIHTAMAKCSECHDKLFIMKKGSSKIGFANHSAGNYCFSCHNGKTATYDCSTCHMKVPVPKAPITYRPKDAAPVQFSHEFHTQIFKCQDCHTKLWPMKKSTKKMTMDAMNEGKHCGACHNGKVAFEATDCDKCHIESKK